jgi:hypothetical protein
MWKTFALFLRAIGRNEADLAPEDRTILQKIYDETNRQAEAAGAEGLATVQARSDAIMGTARAAAATAVPAVRADLLEFAAGLLSGKDTVVEAQRKIMDKLPDFLKQAKLHETRAAEGQTMEFIVPAPDAELSKRDIISIFGSEREEPALYRRAARAMLKHAQGNSEFMPGIMKELATRQGLLRVHDDDGKPRVRMIPANAGSVAIQNLLTTMLSLGYDEGIDVTDALVTPLPTSAEEDTLPEVEGEDGVRFVKTGEPYPQMGAQGRTVTVKYLKYGAAISEFRETMLFDRIGTTQAMLSSAGRQLRNKRAAIRIYRICDNTGLDGKYVNYPGSSDGATTLYSATADAFRGNINKVTSNGLAAVANITAARLLLRKMKLKDGSFVKPVLRVILVPEALALTAWGLVNSVYDPQLAMAYPQTTIPNYYGGKMPNQPNPVVVSDPLIDSLSATSWYCGDPSRQFFEKVVWAPEVVPVIVGSPDSLRDVVRAWKASACTEVVALSNMFMTKNEA